VIPTASGVAEVGLLHQYSMRNEGARTANRETHVSVIPKGPRVVEVRSPQHCWIKSGRDRGKLSKEGMSG
jgi:hypothetical protein